MPKQEQANRRNRKGRENQKAAAERRPCREQPQACGSSTSVNVDVGPADDDGRRLVILRRGGATEEHRIDTDDDVQLEQLARATLGEPSDAAAVADLRQRIRDAAEQFDSIPEEELQATQVNTQRKSEATTILEQLGNIKPFHTPDNEAYATIEVGNHTEHWSVTSTRFEQFVRQRYWKSTGRVPSAQSLKDALGAVSSQALFDGSEHQVHVRMAEHEGSIYVDLCNDDWQAIRIDRDGWKIVNRPKVKFRRPRGMLPLPKPIRGGRIDELREFVNAGNDDDWRLFVGELLSMFFPRGPFVVVVNYGEQGTAKTTRTKITVALIDPKKAPIRSVPRDDQNLLIAASNSYLLAFDNLSYIPDAFSDSLCRLTTGGGFATRELYSNSEEVIFDVRRPVLINGIEDLATRGDLLDRCIIHELPQIRNANRRSESEFWQKFEQVRPRVLGALLDAVAVALRNIDDLRIERLPRMADFVRVVSAGETAFGWAPGTFQDVYRRNRLDAQNIALEASPIVSPLFQFMSALRRENTSTWQGTAENLLRQLGQHRGLSERSNDRQGWPKHAGTLSNKLRRLAPSLRTSGLAITFERTPDRNRTRLVVIRALNSFRPHDPSHYGPGVIPRN